MEKPPEIGVFGGFGEKPDFGVLLIVDFWSLLLKKPVFFTFDTFELVSLWEGLF